MIAILEKSSMCWRSKYAPLNAVIAIGVCSSNVGRRVAVTMISVISSASEPSTPCGASAAQIHGANPTIAATRQATHPFRMHIVLLPREDRELPVFFCPVPLYRDGVQGVSIFTLSVNVQTRKLKPIAVAVRDSTCGRSKSFRLQYRRR